MRLTEWLRDLRSFGTSILLFPPALPVSRPLVGPAGALFVSLLLVSRPRPTDAGTERCLLAAFGVCFPVGRPRSRLAGVVLFFGGVLVGCLLPGGVRVDWILPGSALLAGAFAAGGVRDCWPLVGGVLPCLPPGGVLF